MATITITAAAGPAAQAQHDVGAALGLGRDATLAEIKDYLIADLRALHQQIARNEANAALVIPDLDLT